MCKARRYHNHGPQSPPRWPSHGRAVSHRSLSCWEWIQMKGHSVFALATMLWSYLKTFLDSINGSQRLLSDYLMYENKHGSPRNCPSVLGNGVRKRRTSPLKSSRAWRWDLIVPIKKRSSLWGNTEGSPSLKTTRVENLFAFVEFFLLGSNESILRPGFLFSSKGYSC